MVENSPELFRFLAALIESDGEDAAIVALTEFARATLDADYAGVTLLRPKQRFETIGATDEIVNEIDHLQYDLREGVCVDASIEGRMKHSDDVGADPRWPTWGPATAGLGVRSMISCELHGGGHRLGALNVYGKQIGQFTFEDRELLSTFSAPASAAVAVAKKS